MEQTFDDLCNECKDRTEKLFSLTVQLSVDTGMGIVKEHVLHLSQRKTMSGILRNPKAAAIIGLLLLLPGAIMLSLLVFNIEPPLGPLGSYLQPPGDGPHILGSLIVLLVILVLPAAGVLINVAATEGNPLKSIFSHLGLAAIVGFLLVLPFIIMELVFGRTSYSSFPFPLFGILWFLPVLFVVVIAPIVRTVRAGNSIMVNPITFLLRVAFLIIIATFWVGLVNDQMPCFLGVPNCD